MQKKRSLRTIIAQGYSGLKKQNPLVQTYDGMEMPIELSTAYPQNLEKNSKTPYLYARVDHPSAKNLETLFSSLDEGKASLVFNSGMAAMNAFFSAFPQGSSLFVQENSYFVTKEWFQDFAQQYGLDVTYVQPKHITQLKQLFEEKKPALLWLESPNNPFWNIVDIESIAKIAKAKNCLLAIDNTAATPVLSQPLIKGADFVFHSASKVLSGHGDIIAGVLSTNIPDSKIWLQTISNRRLQGSILSAFDCWLLSRSLRTLYVRIMQSSQTAFKLAKWLEEHEYVNKVYYTGLDTHPDHLLAKKDMPNGYGCTLSFTVNSKYCDAVKLVMSTEIFNQATSYGEIDSRIELRNIVQKDLTEPLLRLSVGLEDFNDLQHDLKNAFLHAKL